MQHLLAYQKRISGPLLDRIDMVIPVARVAETDLLKPSGTPESPRLRALAEQARQKQYARNNRKTNAELSSKNIAERCQLTPEAITFLNDAAKKLSLSARSYFKVIKVARTIADLDDNQSVSTTHIAEALQYRRK